MKVLMLAIYSLTNFVSISIFLQRIYFIANESAINDDLLYKKGKSFPDFDNNYI